MNVIPEVSTAAPPRLDAAASGSLFVDAGEMGALMQPVDWASTPLGQPATWPQSLVTTVSTCLHSRFPILVWWGRELTMIYNATYAPMLGAKHPWALGRPGREVWAEIWDIIGPMLESVMARGEATWSDNQMLPLHRHGYTEECYFTFTYSPIRDESGGVGGVFCAVIETTERVIGERRLAALRELGSGAVMECKRAVDACRAAAAVLDRHELDLPFALIYLTDEKGGTASLAGTAGVTPDQCPTRITLADMLDARWPAVARPWPEPARDTLVLPIARAGQGQPWGVLVAGISPRRPLDDRYRGFLELVAAQLAVGVENARAYEEEQRRSAALAELDRAKTAFFSNVSHEFRTPLSLLLGPAEELLADGSLGDGHRSQVELVHRNALRLLTLVNALLDFSRIEAGRAEGRFEKTDVASLTAEVASTFRSAIEKAGLELDVRSEPLPAGVEVYVDRAMWERIVLNLLSNAFKHTFSGGIVVSVAGDKSRVTLEVSDTGVGIPETQLPNLFKRFHRVPNARARTHEGSGIGLAFVQELVHLHGGTVSVRSVEGRGTTFTVTVPTGSAHLSPEHLGGGAPLDDRTRVRLSQEMTEWSGTRDAVSPPVRPGKQVQGRILLADDNADMREYATRLLVDAGWEVVAVPDGVVALDAARLAPPDGIVSDVMMPRLDGFGLLKALRADPATRDVPVILLSARAGEEARAEGFGVGADDYLVKPFAARELTARVKAHVTLARERTLVKQRLATVLGMAPVAIAVMCGPDHVYEMANEPYQAMVGSPALIGRSAAEALPELAAQGFFTPHNEVFASGEMRALTERRPSLGQDGEEPDVFYNVVITPMLDAAGKPESLLVVASDVTAQVHGRRQAEEANRVKSDFLAAMSHELRTPLNAIAGYVDLLDLGVHGTLSEGQRQFISRIRLSQQHLLARINDVLNYAKIEAGRVEYDLQPVQIADGIRAVSGMVESLIASKGILYEMSVDNDLVALADADKLHQILLNLLSNATKFTPVGGRVRVDARRAADRILVRVSDTGIGIPPEKHGVIFDPFVQVNRGLTRNVEGTGLGLAISRDLARGMGAELSVESDVGKGSTFVLALTAVEYVPSDANASSK